MWSCEGEAEAEEGTQEGNESPYVGEIKGPSPSLTTNSQTRRVYLKINSWILILKVKIHLQKNL